MSPTARSQKLGPLDCNVIDGGPTPDILVVACHGYGAPGSDLVPLGGEWIARLGDDASRFRFVFPQAPSSLEHLGMPEGRAWWPINMAQLMDAVEANQFDQLHTHEPPGIDSARESLCETVAAAKATIGPSETACKATILGGFSQGAMVTMDAALRGDISPPEMLFQFSGTLVCQDAWKAAIDRLKSTAVFQSHGTTDLVLPVASARQLHELLIAGQPAAELDEFVGPHTISAEAVDRSAAMMRQVAADV